MSPLTQFRYLSQNYRESEYLLLYTSDDVGECCECELSVLTQRSSGGYLSLTPNHHHPLQSYPLRQPGEMCASSLSRISKIRSGPPLGGWFSLFNKIAKTQTGPSWTRSKSGLSSKSTGSLKSDRLVDRSLSLPSLKKQSSSTS